MRKILLLFLFKLSLLGVFAQANNNGFYETYIIINNTYYDLGANTGNPNLQGNNLGTFSCTNSLILNGFQTKIFKCNACNVTNVKLNYRVFKNGSTPGSFSAINFSSVNNISGAGSGCQNQQWENTGGGTNLISGLADGTYTVEVYTDGQGTNCNYNNFFDTNLNGGSNYSATFTISNPITVASQPTTPTVCFGGNTTLNAAATGVDAFIWQKQSGAAWVNISNGSVASGATTSLNLTNITTTEVYRCLFTNCGGMNTLASNAITVTPQRPTITVQPRPQTDCKDNDVTFDITAMGAATMSYHWEKKLVGGSFVSVVGDANITNPTVNSIKISNIGNTSNPNLTEYRCIITDGNTCSVTSDPAVMTVNSIQGTLSSQTICEGSNASYTINIIGSVLGYQWQKRIGTGGAWGDILTSDGGKYSGYNSNTLIITGATNTADNDNYYHCIVTFAASSSTGTTNCPRTSDNGRLVVVAYPTIPTHINTTEKGCVGITNSLNSTGCSPNVTTWYDSGNNVVGTGANLTVTKNTPGSYVYYATCTQTSSGCVSLKSSGVTFIVNDLPSVSLGIVPDICNNVTTFSLPYTATGSPNRYSISAGTPAMSGFASLPNTTSLGSSPISVTIPANVTPNTYQFIVTVRSTTTTCISNPQSFTVKINDTPAAPPATASINYCQNVETLALSATATNSNVLVWYGTSANGGTSSISPSTPSSALVGTTNYYVSQKNTDNCESSRTAINVIVNENPAAPISPVSVKYCKNATATALLATALGSNTLVWYDANDNVLPSAPTPNTSNVGTQTFKVSQKSPTPANCEGPKTTITITIFDNPVAPTITTPVGYCQNTTATSLSAIATGSNVLLWYGTNVTGGSTSGIAPIPTTAFGGTTSYYVSQKDVNNCESQRAKIDVEITPSLSATITGVNGICLTGALNNSTILTLNPTGGNSVFTYQWQNIAGNIASATSQMYKVTNAFQTGNSDTYKAIITSGYCTTSTSLTVTKQGWNDIPNVTGNIPEICESGSKTLSIINPNAFGTYKWFTDSTTLSQISSGTSYITPSLSAAMTYYVAREQAITANLTCQTERSSVTINVVSTPPTPTIINSANKTTFCNNESSFTLSTSCSAGSGQYRLNGGGWINGNSVIINPASYPSSVTFTYDFKCVLSATCESLTTSTTIMVSPAPIAPNISGNTFICTGDSTTLTASNCSGTLIWSNGATINSINVSSSGTYSAICTVNGCLSSASSIQTVVVNAIPNAPIISSDDADNIVCEGTNVLLTASNCSGTLIWSNGATANSINVSSSGTYSAICTVNGCLSSASSIQTVVVNAIPNAPIISSDDADNIVCEGTNVLLTASNCSGTLIWSNGATTNSINVSSSGTYSAICTVNGCLSSASSIQTVVVNAIPNAPIISSDDADNIVCEGTNVLLTASNCSGTLIWSNGATTNSINVSSSGTYSAICTVNGCLSSASSIQTVVVNAIPNAPIISSDDADNIVCEGTNVLLTASNCSGTLIWSNGATTNSINVSSSGTYSAICTVNGCVSSASSIQTVVVNAIPNAPIISSDDADNIVCEGTNVLLTASNCSGTLIWSNGATANSINVSSSGTYSAICTVNGCLSSASSIQTVVVNAIPNAPIISSEDADNIVCEGTNVLLTASNCSGTLIWSNGATANSINVSSSGTYSAICTVNGCLSSASSIQTVVVNAIPNAPIISGNPSFCSGNSTQLTANGCAGIITWNTGATGSTLNVSNSGSFSATCTENMCISAGSSPFNVSEKFLPTITLGTINNICNTADTFNLAYIANSNNPDKYSLTSTMPDFINVNEKNLLTSPLTVTIPTGKTGTFRFTLNLKNNSTGCVNSQTFNATILPVLVGGSIEISPNAIYCAGYNPGTISSVSLASGGKNPYTYQWQKSTDNVNFSDILGANLATYDPSGLNQTTYYRRKVSDACGAEAFSSNTHKISIVPDPVVSISSDKINVCTGEQVNFNLNVTESGTGTCTTTWKSSNSFSMTLPTTEGTGSALLLTLTNSGTTIIKKYFQATYNCSVSSCNNANSNVLEITINPSPSVLSVSGGGTICSGESTTLTASACNGSFLWSNGATTSLILVSTAGSYSANCINSCGTSITSNVVVVNVTTIDPPILSGGATICGGQTTILTASNCTGTVVWSNSSSGTSISVSPSTTTSYTAVCVENGCTSEPSSEVMVVVGPSIDFNVDAISDLCNSATSFILPYTLSLGNADKYSLTSTMGGFVSINDNKLLGSSILVTIPAGQTGTFIFTLTLKISATGCIKSQNFSITVLPILNGGSIELSPNSTNCAGYNPGTISSVSLGSGGKNPYTYQWRSSTDGNSFNDILGANLATYDPSGLNQTTYYRRKVSDACGAEAFSSNTHKISIVPDPVVSISSDKINVCTGEQVNFNLNVTESGTGTCTTTWKSSNSFSMTSPTTEGTGSALLLTLTNSGTTIIKKYFQATYNCSVSSCNNANSNVLEITINPSPSVLSVSGGGTICSGESTTLTASACNGSFLWSNGATTSLILVSTAGSYSANCINSCGTSITSNVVVVNVTTIDPPILSGGATICGGQTTILTASNCTGTVVWSNSSSGTSISVSPSTTTSYTAVCVENGCTSEPSSEVIVVVGPSIDFNVDAISDLCNSATSFILPYTLSLGNADKYSLTSTMGGFVSINDNKLLGSSILVTIPAGQTGTFIFTLTLKISATGCIKSQNFSITVLPILNGGSIELSPNSTNCAGYNPGTISSVSLGSGGKNPYTYQWQSSTDGNSFNDILGANLATYDPSGLNQTTYYRRKVSDACGAEAFSSNTHKISIVPDPVVSISSDKINVCTGEQVNFNLNVTESGTGTCTTTWKSSNSFSMTSPTTEGTGSALLLTLTNSGTTIIKKYFQATYNCSVSSCNNANSNVLEITINPSPSVLSVSGGGTICSGESTTLTASACNGSFLWSNGATTSLILVSTAGSYSANCINSCGTSITSNVVVVNVTTIDPPILSGGATICGGQTTILTASNCTGTVVWSNSSSGTSISVSPSTTTSYTAVCVENGCTSEPSSEVIVVVGPSIDFNVDAISDLCNSATSFILPYTLSLGNADKYSLTSTMGGFVSINDNKLLGSSILVTIPAGQTGTFIFTLTLKISATGCIKSQNFSITVLPILNGGSIELSPNSTNCAGYNPGTISSVSLGSGGKNPYTYQWQSSTDGNSFNDILGANLATYDPSGLNQTTYYRRKVSDACGAEAFSSNTHKISIVPDPAITISDTNDKTICSGSSIGLDATFSGGFGSCTPIWQSSDSPSSGFVTVQSDGESFTKILTNATLSPIIKYFRVIYACSGTGSGSCNQATSTVVKVTISNIPNVPIITPASVVICSSQSTTLTASGCSGLVTWTGGQTGNTLSVDVSGSYTATCSINNCTSIESLPAIVLVASDGLAVTPPVIEGTTTICTGQSTNLTAKGCTGLVLWSDGKAGANISVNPSISTNYTATCNDGTCTSNASNQVVVTVNNYPVISSQPKNDADCSGNSVSFSVTASPVTNYQWQRKTPNGSFIDIPDAIRNSLTISDVGSATDPNLTQYQVTVSNATCSVTSTVAILTVNAITGNIADQTICEGSNISLDLTNINTTGTIQSYQWQKRVGSSGAWNDIIGANASVLTLNNVTNADEQYYRCKINFTVGNSTCSRYTTEEDTNGAKLIVLAATTPNISGNNTICSGKSTTLTANNCDGSIIWSSGQSTSIIKVSPTTTTSYSVTCTSSQCSFNATSATFLVEVNETPPPTNITQDVTTPAALVFSASTNIQNGRLLWYDKATGGTGATTAPVFTTIGKYSYWVTQTNSLTGCESMRLPVIAKVLDYFHLIAQPSTQADCKGNSVYMDVSAVSPNNSFTYQWQRKRPTEADFSNLISDGNGIKGWYAKTMVVSNVGNGDNPNQTQYRCIVSNGTESLTSDIAILSVNSVIGALPNIGTCVGSDININLPSYFTITGNVKSYQWQTRAATSGSWTDMSDGNGVSGSTTDNLKFKNINDNQGVYYRCLVKFDTQGFECIEATDPGKLIVSGYPPAPSVDNHFYCQFSNASKLKVNSPIQNLIWYTQAIGGVGSSISPIPNTNTSGVFSYFVADRTDQGCEGPRTEIKVEIGEAPQAPINTTPSSINEGTILTFSADGSPKEGQILRWYNSPTGTLFTTTAPSFTAVGTYKKYVAQLSAFGCIGPRTLIIANIIPNLKFIKQPISQADCDGNSVTFSVSATASGTFTYQWQKKKPNDTTFTNILNEISNSLKISVIGDSNNPNLTKYRCVIKDEKGVLISEEVVLTVNEIKGNLANMALCDGKTTKLSFNKLEITGKVVAYQWQKKEGNTYVNLQTGPNGIANVSEVGTYRGKITFFVDNKTSCSRNTDDLKLEIKPLPPAPQVSNQTICQDIAFNLEKSVKASNPLIWYDNITDTTGEAATPKIDLSKIGKTTFYVSQLTQFGCESERKSFDITIASIPPKPILDDASFCRNMPNVTLPILSDQENQLVWYASATTKDSFAAPPIINTKNDGVKTYFVCSKNLAGCESEKMPLKITIAPCIATFEDNYNNCLQVSADSVVGDKWYDLYDNRGSLYASVNPNGLNLGKVTLSIRHYGRGSNAIPTTKNETRLMARYVDFQSSLLEKFEKPVSLRVYYSNDELSEYKVATKLPNLTINDFNIVHYDGIREDCGFENNDNYVEGNSVVIYKNVLSNQITNDFFYLQFNVNEFSENGATANDFTDLTISAKETNDETIKLNWQTNFEVKEDKFILERSADCLNWASLGLIKANGSNSSYEKIDNQPLGGKNCYRLVYIDKDGTKKYLDPVEVALLDQTPVCSVFPNPWTIGDEVNLYLRNINAKEIKLFDLIGQQYSFNWEKDKLGIIHIRPYTYLNKGLHLVLVIDENGKQCLQKIVINP
ncbi:hypothetical protein [Emticicia sp. SJ17W-69]|uniref:Ig-like domain-containing protein n=1 Tax=Emticicia sp. SJ17W-69 TaxID=3421657 RepID=UPI003EBA6D58